MAQIDYIKDLYEKEGLSLREIARRTKKDFRTVQKYAYQDDWNRTVNIKTDSETFPVMGKYIPIVDSWLEQDEREPRKQRHTVKRIFYHIGGVPIRVKCDNMTTAVAQILEGIERFISDGFYRFMLHHRFKADFCTPAKGSEKGSVENKVGYTRRNMLVPVPVITDFDEFNSELFQLCDTDHERTHYQKGKL